MPQNKQVKSPPIIASTLLLLIGFVFTAHATQTKINVSSLAELRAAVQESDQHIVMQPGDYSITELPRELRNFPCTGDNNRIEMALGVPA